MRIKKQRKPLMFVTTKYFDNALSALDKAMNRAIHELTVITNEGFDSAQKQMNARFDQVDRRLERIELRQDQMVYRFEHDDLERRVKRIEHKIGLADR